MPENPYQPPPEVETIPRQSVGGIRISRCTILALVVCVLGALVCTYGMPAILLTLVMENTIIDDGHQPGDRELLEAWQRFGYAPRFIYTALAGVVILIAGFVLLFRDQTMPDRRGQ